MGAYVYVSKVSKVYVHCTKHLSPIVSNNLLDKRYDPGFAIPSLTSV